MRLGIPYLFRLGLAHLLEGGVARLSPLILEHDVAKGGDVDAEFARVQIHSCLLAVSARRAGDLGGFLHFHGGIGSALPIWLTIFNILGEPNSNNNIFCVEPHEFHIPSTFGLFKAKSHSLAPCVFIAVLPLVAVEEEPLPRRRHGFRGDVEAGEGEGEEDGQAFRG